MAMTYYSIVIVHSCDNTLTDSRFLRIYQNKAFSTMEVLPKSEGICPLFIFVRLCI